MAVRLSGMVSGLDTDALVSELVSAYSKKKDNVVKAQTKLSWTQDAWKSMNTKIYSFYTEQLAGMRFSKNYNKKTSTVSNSSVAKVTAASTAVNGTQELKVKQLATSGYLTGGKISGEDGAKLKGSSKLSEVDGLKDYTGGAIEVTTGGKTSKIELSGDMTINQLVVKLKDMGLNASFDENNARFFVSSATSGADADFSITGSNTEGTLALQKLGLFTVNKDSAEYNKYLADSQLDIAAAANKAYEAQKASYTTADAEKTKLEEKEKTLQKELDSLATQKEYLDAKSKYLTLNYTETEEDVLDESGNPTYDENNNKITRKVVSFASENELSDAVSTVKTDIADYEARIKELGELDTLTDEQKAEKASLENKLKAANDALTELENGVYTAADIKALGDKAAEELATTSDKYTETAGSLAEVKNALSSETNLEAYVAERNVEIDEQNAELQSNLTAYYTNLKTQAEEIVNQYNSGNISSGAIKITGQDSIIELNGAEFTSNSNNFQINGLTIQATAVTGEESVTITTDTDVDGVYDMIKDFISSYNELIKAMDTSYNAASSKGYEPLTDDEKDAMTESEIDKWETKIKDSLLRRDSTLGNLSSMMKTIMSSAYEVTGGSKLSLATFGISTGNYFTSGDNEKGVLHIAGDEDDSKVSGEEDKLRAAIAKDPDQVIEFFSKLSTKLYTDLTNKMSATSLSSSYTVYNDKQMASQYTQYTSDIKDWEDRIAKYEDSYFSKFAAMESALAKLQSQTSSLSGLF